MQVSIEIFGAGRHQVTRSFESFPNRGGRRGQDVAVQSHRTVGDKATSRLQPRPSALGRRQQDVVVRPFSCTGGAMPRLLTGGESIEVLAKFLRLCELAGTSTNDNIQTSCTCSFPAI